jgi:hypothetical protein
MALRAVTWVLSGSTALDSNSVVREYNKVTDHTYLTDGTHLVRSRTIVTREWLCLTQSAAQQVVDCKAANADTKKQYTARENGRVTGEWIVTAALDSTGAWGAA